MISQYTVAPRARACSSSSRTSTAPPSPITKPSRRESKGREACSGSSLLAEVALIASKHATVIGVIGESDAPAMQTSTRPSSMEWKA